MSWDAYHRRRDVMRQALLRADRTDDSAAELLRTFDPDGVIFGSETEFVREVQMTWFQSLSGELDRSRYLGSRDLTVFAARAWAQTAADMPGARRLLDADMDNPDLAKAFTKEDALLSVAIGFGPNTSASHARDVRDQARRMHPAPRQQNRQEPTKQATAKQQHGKPQARPSLLSRVRHALAA